MRSLGFVVLWVAGCIAAVSVAFAGIAIVDDELINPPAVRVADLSEPPPSPTRTAPDTAETPSGDPVGREVLVDSDVAVTPEAVDATSTPASTTPSPATPVPAIPTAIPPTPVPATAIPAPPTPAPATPVPATPPSPVPPTPVPPTAVPPTPVPPTPVPPTPEPPPPTSVPAAQVLTFNLVGGTTAFSFSSTGVEVLWATPNSGFSVEVKPGGDDVTVEFESDNHKSRIDAWWSDGPQHRTREDSD